MSIETDIPTLLFTHIAAFDPDIQIAFPNVEFTPPQESYLEVRFLPNDNRNVYVRNDDPTIYIGFLQVTVVAPSNIGEILPRNLAGKIVNHFSKGTKLQSDNTIVKIYARPSIASMIQDEDRVRVPVSIPYQSSG